MAQTDRDSITAVLDCLEWEVAQARMRGNDVLASVYEGLLSTLREAAIQAMPSTAA